MADVGFDAGQFPNAYRRPAVSTGDAVYTLGGYATSPEWITAHIVRYDGTDGGAESVAALPSQRFAGAAVWTGEEILVLGGAAYSRPALDEIVSFDPQVTEVTLLEERLPHKVRDAAAVWTGRSVIILGGSAGTDETGFHNAIVDYDPSAKVVRTMSATLPQPMSDMAAVWTGQHVLLFGGAGPVWGPEGWSMRAYDTILRYDPHRDVLEVLDQTLPHPRFGMAAVWDGRHAFLFGGTSDGTESSTDILRLDPERGRLSLEPLPLPVPRAFASAVWDGHHALLLGGRRSGPSDDSVGGVWTYHPHIPGPPLDLAISAGPGLGQVQVAWQHPDHADLDAVRAYRIYRGSSPGEQTLIAEVSPGTVSYTDRPPSLHETFYYGITAHNRHGESPPSATVCSAPFPFHLFPSVQSPCSVPVGMEEREIANYRIPAKADLTRDPLLVVELGPDRQDPKRYRLHLQAGNIAHDISVFSAGLVPVHTRLDAGNFGRVDAEKILHVSARYDPERAVCMSSISGQCAALLPYGPSHGPWLLGPGAQAELIVEIQDQLPSGTGEKAFLRIPMAGQAWGQPAT